MPITNDCNLKDFRFPVQTVIRPDLDFRGFAGQIASGVIRRGDPVRVLPSGRTSRVRSIVTWEGELEEAFAPMSVTLCLEDEIDISRGDMLVPLDNPPHSGRRLEAGMVWMSEKPLEPNHSYLLKHTTQVVNARVREGNLQLNEIGSVSLETQRPLFFDSYRSNRATGAFILIDAISNETVGAGMISAPKSETRRAGRVTPEERRRVNGHPPLVICLPPADHQTAHRLERELFDRGCHVHVLEGLSDLRPALRAALAAGLISLIVPESPEDLAAIRESLAPGTPFIEVHDASGAFPQIWQEIFRQNSQLG